MYLLNIHLKKNTLVANALLKITGMGHKMSIQACDQIGISKEIKLESLSHFQINQLNQIIHQNYLVETELHSLIKKNKARLCFISCFRGFRHIEGLPCHGQRTHTNARNSRKQRSITKTTSATKGRS